MRTGLQSLTHLRVCLHGWCDDGRHGVGDVHVCQVGRDGSVRLAKAAREFGADALAVFDGGQRSGHRGDGGVDCGGGGLVGVADGALCDEGGHVVNLGLAGCVSVPLGLALCGLDNEGGVCDPLLGSGENVGGHESAAVPHAVAEVVEVAGGFGVLALRLVRAGESLSRCGHWVMPSVRLRGEGHVTATRDRPTRGRNSWTPNERLLYGQRMGRPRRKPQETPLALAYVRVSTDEQAEHGVSLAAQEAALVAAGEQRGYRVEVVADEGLSAKNMNRPGLQGALARLDAGEAAALLVVRIDRVSRSMHDFSGLLERADRNGWRLVMLSPDLDTGDPSGRFTSHVLAAAAEYERRLIGQRTREALARRKAEGVRLGRRSTLPVEVVQRIVDERAAGLSLRVIADRLTADRVATGQGGGKWHASTVSAVLDGATARGLKPRKRRTRL